MTYKIVNNVLDFRYGIDVVESIYSFRKIKFSELFKTIEEERIQDDSNQLSNSMIGNAIFNNYKSIDDILKSLPADESNDKISDKAVKIATPIIKKIEHQKKVSNVKILGTEQEVGDIKAIKIANDIEARMSSDQDSDYIVKIKKAFLLEGNLPVCGYLDTLFKYKNSSELTWYDVGVIAWSINSFFSYYFQSLFVEVSKLNNYIYDDDLESDAGRVLDKIKKGQTIEIYDMFKFVNRVQENGRTELISKLEKQENKDKYNLLKCFLDSESVGGIEASHFYKIALINLRKFRNFHAHHDDERIIEKFIYRNTPEKIKIKFYNKFLGDLDENGTGFLQFIIERI